MNDSAIIECVPNFSEGRDRQVLDAIAAAISGTEGASLLDVDPGADTNRTVYTFVGNPEAVLSAAMAAARVAFNLIDMRLHKGEHPRMGALDVCPFVPVSGATMEDCARISRRFGAMLASELGIPVFLYENAATRPERRSLADIRSGEYEGLPAKLADPEWFPDFGPASFVPRWGATVTGAREFLIAYNVNLNTKDKRLATEIALTIREGGRAARDSSGAILKDEKGETLKIPGLLPSVRAIGWYIESYRCAQVSINLLDYRTTPLHAVFDTVRGEAEKLGLVVTGSELVGLVPLEPMLIAGRHYLARMGKSPGACESELVELATRTLGLDSVSTFDPRKKIIEYASGRKAWLAGLTVSEFVDEVSADSAAPGGGSVAALAGSLGAALAAMVANLTVGKRGYEPVWKDMASLALRAQEIKSSLLRAVDEDTIAYKRLMEAMKLPKASPAEVTLRDAAIQEGYRNASLVPLSTARACLEAIRLCHDAARSGNRNSASDGGVGALMAKAGLEGAVLNIWINLVPVKDEEFKADMRAKSGSLTAEARSLCDAVLESVMASIQG